MMFAPRAVSKAPNLCKASSSLCRTSVARAFSTTALPNGITLAYDLHEPPKDSNLTQNAPPIIFIHGLFGSKRNNGSMSKYAACALRRDHAAYILPESLPAS